MTFKSLLFPLDIDTLGLVERYGNWVVYVLDYAAFKKNK